MALIHTLLVILLAGPVVLMLVGWWKGRQVPVVPPRKHRILPLIVNSTLLYALSYNIIYFVQELFLALGKQWIGLTAYLYHNNHNWEGSDPRDALMQGTGALTIFILGIIFLFVYLRIRGQQSWWVIFTLWLAHHGLIQSLPQFGLAPLDSGSDTGQALAYLQLPGAVNIALGALCIVAIVYVSFKFSRYFLTFGHPSVVLDHPFKRSKTVWHAAVLPAILGTILLFPYRIPPVDRYTMTVMLLTISIPAIFAFAWVGKAPAPRGNEARGRLLILPIILTVFVLLIFQLVLRPGMVFVGN